MNKAPAQTHSRGVFHAPSPQSTGLRCLGWLSVRTPSLGTLSLNIAAALFTACSSHGTHPETLKHFPAPVNLMLPTVLVELQGIQNREDNGEFTSVTHRGVIRATFNSALKENSTVLIRTFDNGYEKDGWLIVHPSQENISRMQDGTLLLDATDFNFMKVSTLSEPPEPQPTHWQAMRDIIHRNKELRRQ